MNYVFTMTLSGSCIYLAYRMIRKIAGEQLSEKWYYMLLKVTALFYLIPLPFLKQIYTGLLEPWSKAASDNPVFYFGHDESVVFMSDHYIQFNHYMKVQGTILLIWIFFAVLVGACFWGCYLKRRLQIAKMCRDFKLSPEDSKVVAKVSQKLQVHTRVQFMPCIKGKSPFTIGFFKPLVFLDLAAPEEEKELLLKHELIHIKRGDMFWHFASILVVAMHWYNPLAWWFRAELKRVCEYACDETVLQGCDKLTRSKYARILVVYQTEKEGEILEAGLSKAGQETEKRIMKILSMKKQLPVAVSAMLLVAVVALNSLTVFAYEDVKVARGEGYEDGEFINFDFALIPEGGNLVWENPEYVEDYVYHYDVQFVDEDGDVYEVQEDMVPYWNCEHDFVNGTLQRHEKNSTGGCKVYFYDAVYCILCGYMPERTLTYVGEYIVCTH